MSQLPHSRKPWQGFRLRSVALVALPAVIGEAVQHLIEYQLGMYVYGDGIGPGQEARWRMIGVAIKVLGFIWTTARARSQGDLLALSEALPFVFKISAVGVLVALHYALNYAAVGKPSGFVLAALLCDCLVIGALASALGSFLPKGRRFRAG